MVSERRVQQLAKLGVIPKAESGRYELAPAVQGYIRFLQERTIGNNGGSPVDYHTEKARLTRAQADIAEIEAAKARGEVAPIEDVERAWSRAFAELRTNILNVPGRVVRQLLGETKEQRFKDTLRAELAAALEATAQADLVDDEPAAGEGDEDE